MAKYSKFDINAISIPTFNVRLLNGVQVKVRAIVMKEYRNLLLAKDGSSSIEDHLDAIEQVVKNCIVDEDFDASKMTAYDFELIFIKAFEFGTGTKEIPISFQCTNPVVKTNEDGNDIHKPCGSLIKTRIVIDKIRPSVPEDKVEPEKTFNIQEGVDVVLTRPTFKDTAYFNVKKGETIIDNIIRHFKHITVGENISDLTMIEPDELDELFDRIHPTTIKDMHEYLTSIPRASYQVKMKCPDCGKKYLHTLTGIEDFFI